MSKAGGAYFDEWGEVDLTGPTPDEQTKDEAICHFCSKRNPDQFFMEGFWAHDACMDAQYDTPEAPHE